VVLAGASFRRREICTPRIAYSKSLFSGLRPNAEAIALDQEVVSSVVVLRFVSSVFDMG
jgi:hypothetical protein